MIRPESLAHVNVDVGLVAGMSGRGVWEPARSREVIRSSGIAPLNSALVIASESYQWHLTLGGLRQD